MWRIHSDQGEGGFRLHNVITVGFYYLLFTSLLHGSVVRPYSTRNIFIGNYPSDIGSVVIRTLVTVMDNYIDWLISDKYISS
jgi:hypothetical protein